MANSWGIDTSKVVRPEKTSTTDLGRSTVNRNPSNGLSQIGLSPVRIPEYKDLVKSIDSVPLMDKIKIAYRFLTNKNQPPKVPTLSQEGTKAIKPIAQTVARVAPDTVAAILDPKSDAAYQGYVLSFAQELGKDLKDLSSGAVSIKQLYSKFIQKQKFLYDRYGKGFTPEIYNSINPHLSDLGWGLLLQGQPQLARNAWSRHANNANIGWLRWLTQSKTNFYGAPIATVVGIPLLYTLIASMGSKKKSRKRKKLQDDDYIPYGHYNV